MAQEQPLSRHSIDYARDQAREQVRELHEVMVAGRQMLKDFESMLTKMETIRLSVRDAINEGVHDAIKVETVREMKRLDDQVTKLLRETEKGITKRFAGIEQRLITTLMESPLIKRARTDSVAMDAAKILRRFEPTPGTRFGAERPTQTRAQRRRK